MIISLWVAQPPRTRPRGAGPWVRAPCVRACFCGCLSSMRRLAGFPCTFLVCFQITEQSTDAQADDGSLAVGKMPGSSCRPSNVPAPQAVCGDPPRTAGGIGAVSLHGGGHPVTPCPGPPSPNHSDLIRELPSFPHADDRGRDTRSLTSVKTFCVCSANIHIVTYSSVYSGAALCIK